MSLNGVCRKSEFQTSARPYAILIFPEPGTQNPEGADEDVFHPRSCFVAVNRICTIHKLRKKSGLGCSENFQLAMGRGRLKNVQKSAYVVYECSII